VTVRDRKASVISTSHLLIPKIVQKAERIPYVNEEYGSQQEGETAEETWRNTIGSVHTDVGYAPASAMLSAYGFYDGKTRAEGDRNGPAGESPRVSFRRSQNVMNGSSLAVAAVQVRSFAIEHYARLCVTPRI
jgi:hypothetical protein